MLPHGQGVEVGSLLLLLLADLEDAALQRLAQVQHLGVAGQDLCEHDEDVPDVGVLPRLQAVHRRLWRWRRARRYIAAQHRGGDAKTAEHSGGQ